MLAVNSALGGHKAPPLRFRPNPKSKIANPKFHLPLSPRLAPPASPAPPALPTPLSCPTLPTMRL